MGDPRKEDAEEKNAERLSAEEAERFAASFRPSWAPKAPSIPSPPNEPPASAEAHPSHRPEGVQGQDAAPRSRDEDATAVISHSKHPRSRHRRRGQPVLWIGATIMLLGGVLWLANRSDSVPEEEPTAPPSTVEVSPTTEAAEPATPAAAAETPPEAEPNVPTEVATHLARVRSIPEGATLFLTGSVVQNPFEQELPEGTEHAFRATMDGHDEESVRVLMDRPRRVQIDLTPSGETREMAHPKPRARRPRARTRPRTTTSSQAQAEPSKAKDAAPNRPVPAKDPPSTAKESPPDTFISENPY
ncbi:MAG: hypothetical protein KC416_11855 [Myxococcales bacterium]|nr:hypothetical protein [Myxococcales bacterium]